MLSLSSFSWRRTRASASGWLSGGRQRSASNGSGGSWCQCCCQMSSVARHS